MNIREALIKAKETNGRAVLGETELIPFVGRMGTMAGGGTYNDFNRVFKGNACFANVISWEELISESWEIQPLQDSTKMLFGMNVYENVKMLDGEIRFGMPYDLNKNSHLMQ